jgi:TolB-like protein
LFFVTILILFSTTLFSFEKEIKAMSATLSECIIAAGNKTIAVVDFTDLQGNVTELGRFFAEEFSGTLASSGKGFKIIDRTHLKTLLAKHKLSTTGIIDPQTARKLGQIAGVDSLITGTITPFGDTIRLSVKVLETNTAMVIGAASGDIAKTKAIEELLGKGISESNLASNTKNISTGSGTQPRVFNPYFPDRNKKTSSIFL